MDKQSRRGFLGKIGLGLAGAAVAVAAKVPGLMAEEKPLIPDGYVLENVGQTRYDLIARKDAVLKSSEGTFSYCTEAEQGQFKKKLISLMKTVMRRNEIKPPRLAKSTPYIRPDGYTEEEVKALAIPFSKIPNKTIYGDYVEVPTYTITKQTIEDVQNWNVDDIDEKTKKELWTSLETSEDIKNWNWKVTEEDKKKIREATDGRIISIPVMDEHAGILSSLELDKLRVDKLRGTRKTAILLDERASLPDGWTAEELHEAFHGTSGFTKKMNDDGWDIIMGVKGD